MPHLKLLALVIPTLWCDVTPVLALRLFYVKQMSHLLPLFTPFGRAVWGKGTHKIASIGHSILGNAKIRCDTGFSIALFA